MSETGYIVFLILGLTAVLVFLFCEGESIVKDFSARKSVKQQQEKIVELEEELERSKDVITHLNNRIDKVYVDNLVLIDQQDKFKDNLIKQVKTLVDLIEDFPGEEDE